MKRILSACAGFFLVFSSLTLGAIDFRLVSFADYYGDIETSTDYSNLRTRFYLGPEFSGYSENTGLEWYLSAHLYAQPIGEPDFIPPEDILNQAYLFMPVGNFDISLGQKLITLGMADIYGPLNAVNSAGRDLLSLDDSFDSKRADLSLHIQYYPTFDDVLEFIYVPLPRADEEKTGPVEMDRSPLNFQIDWDDSPYLLEHPHSFFAAYTRYTGSFDLQLMYGWYTEQTPDFDLSGLSLNVGILEGSAEAVYHRKHTFGAAISTGLGSKYTLTEEVAFNLSEDFEGTDPGIQNSDITVNTQILGNLPGGILGQLTIVYQYFFNFDNNPVIHNTAVDEAVLEEIRGFHTQPLQPIAFAVGHFEKSFLREKMKLSINAALLYPNVYLGPRIRYSFSDRVNLESGADYTTGDPDNLDLRRNSRDDNFYLRLMYQY